jgi:hypothetical protein
MSSKIVNYITNLISSCQDEDFVNLWESEEKDKVLQMIKEDLEKSSKKKKKKDKNAPKKNVSTWILFSKAERPKVKKDFPDMPPKEVMGELAKRWIIAKDDEEVMEEFRILAEEDKKRYEEEKKNYVPSEESEEENEDEGGKKKKGKKGKAKKAKAPGQPNKPKSSWLFFCDEERKKLKDEEDAPKGKEVLSELASRWKVLKDKKGKKYEKFEDMAKKDKERYLQEMKNWNPDKKEESEDTENEDEKPLMTEEEQDEVEKEEEKVEKEVEEEEDEKPLPKKKGKKRATKSRVNE